MYSQTYSILVRRNIEMSIRIGILGYGNLGRGVEMAVNAAEDLELVGVFSRRDPSKVKIASEGVKVYSADALANMQKDIDVLVICGGSATDLPKMTPVYAKDYNVVDSFDTHARIPEHFKNVDEAAKAAGKTAVISVGWDPGMFSVNRLYSHAILPNGKAYTFWGRGVSQGHSDAIRRIKGVKDARQYTVPVESALEAVRSGSNPELTTRQKHTRECYVVAEEGADLARIEKEIKTMPNYFDEYDTTVNFISEEELLKNHAGLPHGGSVIVSGSTNEGKTKHVIEYKLKLDSNPEFTGSVLAAYARAVAKLNKEGNTGCKTAFDIAPAYLCPEEGDFLRAHFL
jgi:diaminopimelate dehydrogenase